MGAEQGGACCDVSQWRAVIATPECRGAGMLGRDGDRGVGQGSAQQLELSQEAMSPPPTDAGPGVSRDWTGRWRILAEPEPALSGGWRVTFGELRVHGTGGP